MMPLSHTIASGVTSAFFMCWTKSWPAAAACFLSGIFIDLDHLLDFYRYKKRLTFSFQELKRFCLVERDGPMYLVLHSYELLVCLWLSTWVFPSVVWLGVVFGVTVHMLLDQVTNDIYPLAYFWFLRRRTGFSKKIFFKDEFYEEFKNFPRI